MAGGAGVAGADCGADQEAGIAAEVSRGAVCLLALRHCGFVVALMQHDFLLARIRLTRTAAERGPVLSGACGQVMIFGGTWCSRRW
jgi:hypothetical protein